MIKKSHIVLASLGVIGVVGLLIATQVGLDRLTDTNIVKKIGKRWK